MAHSIESRTPLLDYRIVEFAMNLDWKNLINKDISRPLFRSALKPYIPGEVFNRKDKLGYPTPFENWTKSELKNYISDEFLNSELYAKKYLNIPVLMNFFEKHLENSIDISWLI